MNCIFYFQRLVLASDHLGHCMDTQEKRYLDLSKEEASHAVNMCEPEIGFIGVFSVISYWMTGSG